MLVLLRAMKGREADLGEITSFFAPSAGSLVCSLLSLLFATAFEDAFSIGLGVGEGLLTYLPR